MAFRVTSKNYVNILMVWQLFPFSKILFAADVLPIDLGLYLKDLKLLVSAILTSKLSTSSAE